MEMFSLAALAVFALLAGGAATVALGVLLPMHLLERAQRDGRFAGLTVSRRRPGGGSGRRAPMARPAFGLLQFA